MSGAVTLLQNVDWLALLAELAAKATLVLLLTAAAAAVLWRASAAVRHLVWCVGIACVLALPLLTALLPAWEIPLLPARPATVAAVPAPIVDVPPPHAVSPAELPNTVTAAPDASPRGAWLSAAVGAVAGAGVLLGVLWLALGYWGVSRIGRGAELVRDPEWLRAIHDAAEGLGLRRPVLLLRSRGPVMPATWGLLWPSIVVPATADGWPRERRHAVLAHELAHVKRFDCLTQALAQVACVLFWWHPAVWYAARRLRVERERACDDLVLRAGTRASDYAGHLLEIARAFRSMRLAAPAMVSMARPSHLESRLLWVLDGARARNVPTAAATVLTVLTGLLVVTPLAAMRPGERAADPAPAVAETADAGDARFGGDRKGKGLEDKAPKPSPKAPQAASAPSRPEAAPPASPAPADTSPIEHGIDELIAMRSVGVDAQYIRELRAAGYPELDARQLVSLRSVGVSGSYAREMNAAGLGRLTAEQLVSLRSVGVTPTYLAELRAQGVEPRSVTEASGLVAVGVNGAYVAGLRAAGYRGIPVDQLTSLRSLGVTPGYVAELRAVGLDRLSVETLKGLRALGVTGEYVRQLRAAGVSGLDATTLSGMRAMGVSAGYVRELAEVGLTGLSGSDLTQLKASGVTARFVRELRAAGMRQLSVDELVRLRSDGS